MSSEKNVNSEKMNEWNDPTAAGANPKCVLAYSGGLDTSAIVIWLKGLGYEVHAMLVDVGQDEDMEAQCAKAIRLGAASAVIRDAKPAMFASVIPQTIGLASVYEGAYRLGTALARPFIALEQVKYAKELGGATLVHGATGKGNDQIRFEFAYKSLAPQYPVLAPWKVWSFEGRKDLIAYLKQNGVADQFDEKKDYSLDENFWHISVEGAELEDAKADVDVEAVLAVVKDKFATGGSPCTAKSVTVGFEKGVPVSVDGEAMSLPSIIDQLNKQHRHASWAWELIIENRTTGVKSRGLYINPAAKLLQTAAASLAQCCLNKPTYDRYVSLGDDYATLLYRGEYFSSQRQVVDASAKPLLDCLTGEVTLTLAPSLYVSKIDAKEAIFCKETSTFEASAYSHADAGGFINLSWLANIGQPFDQSGEGYESTLETAGNTASDLCKVQSIVGRRLVSSAV
ncbi:MAG: argininosuccinate synthase [Planctomycetes bacterium]|nr:argininosuccinate synthase [Planctomycetota bacterium]